MRRTIIPIAVLTALAVPSVASAAKPTLSPNPSAVSSAGVMTIEAANPNRYAMRGKVTVKVGRKTVAKKSVRLAKRSVSEIKVKFGTKGLAALKAAGGKSTVGLRVRRPGGRYVSASRKLKLKTEAPAPAAPPAAATPAPQAAPAPAPVPTRFVGRMGSEGAYDDLELTVENGQMTITKPPFVPVSCGATGGSTGVAISLELFDAPGPFPVGSEGVVEKQGLAVNTLVNSGARSITYKASEIAADAAKVTGKLSMSFFDSKLDILNGYKMTFINCGGIQSFEAVPAP
jgi:hypothetical protein